MKIVRAVTHTLPYLYHSQPIHRLECKAKISIFIKSKKIRFLKYQKGPVGTTFNEKAKETHDIIVVVSLYRMFAICTVAAATACCR